MSSLSPTWALDLRWTFLNHGSYGATPEPVLAAQETWRRRMEANPVEFFDEVLPAALAESRRRVSAFVGAPSDGLVFVTNATTGVNAALAAVALGPGDEVVVSDHGYNACTNAARVHAGRSGAAVVVAEVPYPPTSPEAVVDSLLGAVSGRTRLVVVDHVTSPTALVLPVGDIVAALEPDVAVVVDGAHAPGMVDLDVAAVGASFYVGNLHKWVCAPKGAGFLWVRPDRRPAVMPPVVSHGWNRALPDDNRLHALFDFVGTADPSAILAVPAALDFVAALDADGWAGVRAANRALVLQGGALVARRLGRTPDVDARWVGSMATITLGDSAEDTPVDPLTVRLRHRWSIEVPVYGWRGRRLLRLSAQRYNTADDYQRLAAALEAELA